MQNQETSTTAPALTLAEKIAKVRIALESNKAKYKEAIKASERMDLLDEIESLQEQLKKLEPNTPKEKKDKTSSISLSKHNDILSRDLITVGGLPIGSIFFVRTILKDSTTKIYKAQKTTESYGSSAVLAEKNKSRTCGCSLIGESGAKNFTNNTAILGIEVEDTYYPVEGGAAYHIITWLNFAVMIETAEDIVNSGNYGSSNKVEQRAIIANCENLQEQFKLQYGSIFGKLPISWNLPTNNWETSIATGAKFIDKFPLPVEDTQEEDADTQEPIADTQVDDANLLATAFNVTNKSNKKAK
jgi:hypothetical protein